MPNTFDSLPSSMQSAEGDSRLFPNTNATPQIADSWALSLDPTKEDDYVLRTAATAIMKERFGITSYDGFVLSGDEARPLKPREFYDKVMKAFRSGSTDAWMEQYDIDFRNAEEGGDRAAMRKIAREHVKGETLGQKARTVVDKYDNLGAADTYGNDEERDKRIREELESIRDAISPEDWSAVEAYFGAGDGEESPSSRKNAAAKRLQELNERLHQIERETISIPAYQETGYEDEIAQISEAELEEMEGGVEKARSGVDAIRRKYHDVLVDERRIPEFKAQMADRNRWAYLAGLHGNITENAERVLTMAEKSAANAGHPAPCGVREAHDRRAEVHRRCAPDAALREGSDVQDLPRRHGQVVFRHARHGNRRRGEGRRGHRAPHLHGCGRLPRHGRAQEPARGGQPRADG